MKKIVIHGCTGLKNSGDEAILQTIIQQYGAEYDLTVISRDVAYTSRMHSGVRVIPDETNACREAIRQCDLFLLGGGGLLQDETTIFNVSVWLKYLKYAIKQGKKVCIYANSIGPVKWNYNRYLVKKYLKRADLITLRDRESAQLLKELGIERQVHVTADPVFSLQWQDAQVQRTEESEYVCIAIRHWFDIIPFIPVKICNKLGLRSRKNQQRYDRYVQTMADVTEYINKELGCDVVFTTFLYGRDDRVAEDILARVRHSERHNTILTDEYLTPENILRVLTGACFLIGMRLHSVIYAMRTHTPMVIIDYSAKVRSMAKLNHLSEYCVDVNTMNAEAVIDAIQRVSEQKEAFEKTLKTQEKQMQEQEKKNKELLQKLMNQTDNRE